MVFALPGGIKGELKLDGTNDKNILIENIVNYNRFVGKHSFGFTGLYSYENNVMNNNTLLAQGFPIDLLTYYQADVATSKIFYGKF